MFRSRFIVPSTLLFLQAVIFSGCQSIPFAKPKHYQSFSLPGTYDEAWKACLETLEDEKIQTHITNLREGYIQTKTFPLYSKEYKSWARKPFFAPSGYCLLEFGLMRETHDMTRLGIQAHFRRKHPIYFFGFGKRDASRHVFETLLAGRINDRLIKSKYPELKLVVLGCNLRYSELYGRYIIARADAEGLAYEQGLRNGDLLVAIDGSEVTPDNLFQIVLSGQDEVVKKIKIIRDKKEIELKASFFHLSPDHPKYGMRIERDENKQFIVRSVKKDSPAERSGLQKGDILREQNGIQLNSWKNYYRAMIRERVGTAQRFTVDRSGTLIEITIIPKREV